MSTLHPPAPEHRRARLGRRGLLLSLFAAGSLLAASASADDSGTSVRPVTGPSYPAASVSSPADLTAGSPASGGLGAILAPRTSGNGLSLVGTVAASWGGSTARMTVDHIVNSRAGGTSGTLRLVLWANPSYPVYGQTITYYDLASYLLSPLGHGLEYNSVDTGTLAYNPPPAGCFYVTVALEEFNGSTYNLEDIRVLTAGGTPDGAGHERFSFGGASCQVSTTSCTPDAHTACLLNNRFKATLLFRGDFTNNPADTQALVKSVTGFANANFETSFFYFNDPNNIEVLLKMLDQGNTNSLGQPTIAVLFGTATPLRVELTITDTATSVIRKYTSPFTSMAGATDFTAFVK